MFKKYHAFAFVEKRSNELASCARLALTEGTLECGIEKVDEWLIREGMKEVSCFSSDAAWRKKWDQGLFRSLYFVSLSCWITKYTSRFDIGQPHKFLFMNAYEQHQWVNSLHSIVLTFSIIIVPARAVHMPDFYHARLQPSQQSNFLSGRIQDISPSDMPRAPSFNRIKNEWVRVE